MRTPILITLFALVTVLHAETIRLNVNESGFAAGMRAANDAKRLRLEQEQLQMQQEMHDLLMREKMGEMQRQERAMGIPAAPAAGEFADIDDLVKRQRYEAGLPMDGSRPAVEVTRQTAIQHRPADNAEIMKLQMKNDLLLEEVRELRQEVVDLKVQLEQVRRSAEGVRDSDQPQE